ncbi:hypothetical protein LguiA_022056 [Lonicera macranthoides]
MEGFHRPSNTEQQTINKPLQEVQPQYAGRGNGQSIPTLSSSMRNTLLSKSIG